MLEFLKVIFLGIVEGITEWLPISSTGHMILVDEFVKLNVTHDFPGGHTAGCYSGCRRSVFSEIVAVLLPKKRMDQKRYLDSLVQGHRSCSSGCHHWSSI